REYRTQKRTEHVVEVRYLWLRAIYIKFSSVLDVLPGVVTTACVLVLLSSLNPTCLHSAA
ncbi:hypothetical protein BKA93DRAFT_931565, partial [Sparassis latifolia]